MIDKDQGDVYETLRSVLEKCKYNLQNFENLIKSKEYEQLVKSKKKELKIKLINKTELIQCI